MDMEIYSQLAFTLRYPDGHIVKIYGDGTVTGVPEGTRISNNVPFLVAAFYEKWKVYERRILENPEPNIVQEDQ